MHVKATEVLRLALDAETIAFLKLLAQREGKRPRDIVLEAIRPLARSLDTSSQKAFAASHDKLLSNAKESYVRSLVHAENLAEMQSQLIFAALHLVLITAPDQASMTRSVDEIVAMVHGEAGFESILNPQAMAEALRRVNAQAERKEAAIESDFSRHQNLMMLAFFLAARVGRGDEIVDVLKDSVNSETLEIKDAANLAAALDELVEATKAIVTAELAASERANNDPGLRAIAIQRRQQALSAVSQ